MNGYTQVSTKDDSSSYEVGANKGTNDDGVFIQSMHLKNRDQLRETECENGGASSIDTSMMDEFGLYGDCGGEGMGMHDGDLGFVKRETLLSNDAPVPLSRPPPKHRDRIFALIFICHFAAIALLSLLEEDRLHNSLISYGRAGSWASLLMIVTLLGHTAGAVVSFFIANADARECFLSMGLSLSIALQASLGNILLLSQSRFSWIGVFVLISAINDSFQYKQARESLNFTATLIQMVIDIGNAYGNSLMMACIVITVAHTCLLLWWGVFFVGLASHAAGTYSNLLILIMGISLYWITQFFHCLMSYVVGGCTVWYFVRDEREVLDASSRVMLHMQCAMTTSLGSICKGALLCPPAQLILVLNHWSKGRPGSIVTRCSPRWIVGTLVSPFVEFAVSHYRLALSLTATYGRTLCKAANEHALAFPETIDISIEDLTGYTLKAAATAIAGTIAIFFGILAEKREGAAWPLFFFVCFYLAYSSMSLIVHAYRSAVDALIVVFGAEPERFARENQIVYLRFLRTTETALR